MPTNFLLNVPRTKADWETYWFAHAQDHLEIQQAILKAKNVTLVNYQIYPADPNHMTDLLERHSQLHIDFDGVLGLQSVDLQTVNFQNENEVASWVYLNWKEHDSARSTLGI